MLLNISLIYSKELPIIIETIQLANEEITHDIDTIQKKTQTNSPWQFLKAQKGQIDSIEYVIKTFLPPRKTDLSTYAIVSISNPENSYQFEGIYSGKVLYEQPFIVIDSYDDNGYFYLSFIDPTSGAESIFIRNNRINENFFLIQRLSNEAIFITGIDLVNVKSEIPMFSSISLTNKNDIKKHGFNYTLPILKPSNSNHIPFYIIGNVNSNIKNEAIKLFNNHINHFICKTNVDHEKRSLLIQNTINDYPNEFMNLSKELCQ